MRKSLLLPVCGLVFNVAVLAALYVLDTSYVQVLFWMPFIPAFLTFGSALLLLGGRRLEGVAWDRFWGAIVVLPRWAQAGLGLLFLVTIASTLFAIASTLTSPTSPQADARFERNFALIAVWITAVGTALHYAVERERMAQTDRR
ncbi:hypothetical protein [Actinoplanes sp. NPDC026670]|uniref:hypothetical protein n=1 Tax=Actinoplanes sp. NPDC026670 TaxID=3154700 RepID=UPI0033DE477D